MKLLFKQLTSIYAVYAFKGLLGILFIPLAIHQLGTENYGIYSIFVTLSAYIVLIELGTSKNLARVLALNRNEDQQRSHLQASLGIYLTFALILLLLSPFMLYLIPNYIFPVEIEKLVILKAIIVLAIFDYYLSIPTTMIQARCIAEEKFVKYSKYQFYAGIFKYVFMFGGILLFSRPDAVIAFLLVGRISDVILAHLIMGGLPRGSWKPTFHFDQFKRLIGASFSLSVSQLFQQLVITIGSILVNRFFGLHALGVYRSAFDLVTKVWFFSNAIGLVVFPKFVRLIHTEERSLLFRRLPAILKISFIFYTSLTIIGVFLAPATLTMLNLSSHDVHHLFMILLLGVCINAHSNLSYEFLQASGRYWTVAGISLVAFLLLFVSFFALVGHTQLLAIGWAWTISQVGFLFIADGLTLKRAQRPVKVIVQYFMLCLTFTSIGLIAVLAGTNDLPFVFLFVTGIVTFLYIIFSYKHTKMQLSVHAKG